MIRTLDVPFGLRNSSFAYDPGESLGGFLEHDDDDDPLGWGEFMRVKILHDINKPLRRGIKIDAGNSSEKWIGSKYERLRDFCYYCGRLGHTDRDCHIQGEEDRDSGSTIYQYGPWLMASPHSKTRITLAAREREKKLLANVANSKCSLRRSEYKDPDAIRLPPYPPHQTHSIITTPSDTVDPAITAPQQVAQGKKWKRLQRGLSEGPQIMEIQADQMTKRNIEEVMTVMLWM
uniref:CCHC-type domain-containing protein n=1 Tax=Chenopodium quinoa TaxID=63459 RepID=A0A803NE34_CHEQI